MKLLFVLLIVITSCTNTHTIKQHTTEAQTREEDCVDEFRLEEYSIRMILYQSKAYWDSLSAAIIDRQPQNSTFSEEVNDFTVQNSEYTKYYNNALMLYLSGDTSYDFYRSLVTIKKLLLTAESCYPDVKNDIGTVYALKEKCVIVNQLDENPERLFLYKSKTKWDELHAQMFSRQLRSEFPDKNLEDIESLKKEFTESFNNALNLYLKGETSSDFYRSSIVALKEILLRAEHYNAEK